MTLEEQKRGEDKIMKVFANLTLAEKAVLYKTLYAEGMKITDYDVIIRREAAPDYAGGGKATTVAPPPIYLPRGIPASKFP